MSRVNNDADLLLRKRQDKKSIVKNDADLLLRVKWDEKIRLKNDADMLLRIWQYKMSRVRMTQTCC